MIKRSVMLMLCSALGAVSAMADSEVSVSIGGGEPQGGLQSVELDGDEAMLTFADNSQATADMAEVAITIVYDDKAAGIAPIGAQAGAEATGKVYGLDGRRIGADGLSTRGVYIVNGKKTVVK